MKKIFLSLLVLAFSFGYSQKDYSRYYNSWRLGFNIGGMWQTSDLNKNNAGLAGGFTLEKGFCENKTNFLSWAIRGRALFGNTYGYSSKKNYNLLSNPALNGTYDPNVNYPDTSGGKKGFIYSNYKTGIGEGALELQISFNRLRERTHIILNLWGGVGFSVFRANTNLLDAANSKYNFASLDSSSSTNNLIAQQGILDRSYESYAFGSKAGNMITFSPSAGIGLGYQFSPAFSILFEYKVTFPQGLKADLLDGQTGVNNHWLQKDKDFYHYAGINFLFTLGGGRHHTKTTTDVTNYTQGTTNTVVPHVNTNTQTTTVVNQNVTNGTNVYAAAQNPPIVKITSPGYSPYTSYTADFTIQAKVYNVVSRDQVNVTFNGAIVTGFNYYNGNISFPVTLMPGNNNVIISATNKAGSDSKSDNLFFTGNPPVITIINPTDIPHTTTQPTINVLADVLNINSGSDISVKLNGNYVNVFTYNVYSTEFATNLKLNEGINNFEITATNMFGKDYKHLVIQYNNQTNLNTVVVEKGVSVTIVDPNVNPFIIKTNNYPVTAKVTGVSSASQVTVTVNGNNTSFNYFAGSVTFNPSYNLGSNTIVVSARNTKSFDSKSTVIIYQEDKKFLPPNVIILSPATSPYISTNTNYIFRAQTTNITNVSQLEIKFNNSIVNNYTFNVYTGLIEFNTNLLSFTDNVFEVKATNTDGSASASAIVKHEEVNQIELDQKTIVICHKNADGSHQTITIRENQWPQHAAHGDTKGECVEEKQITICHIPPGNPNNPQTITIPVNAWPAHQAHGDYIGACQMVVDPITIGTKDPDMIICHKNADDSRQTISIKTSQWPAHEAHGDIKGACAVATATMGGPHSLPDNDISICHTLPGGGHQTITIKESEWSTHAAHGDYRGICNNTGNMGGPQSGGGIDRDIVICHLPPGNTNNPQTITIKESAWPAHQAHGDSRGECPAQNPIKTINTQTDGGNKEGNNNQGRPTPKTIEAQNEQTQNINQGRPIQKPDETQQPQQPKTNEGGVINGGRPR